MKIIIPTTKPGSLKKKIFDSVREDVLKTWEIRKGDSEYLTHTPPQWYDCVIMRFTETTNTLEIDTYWWKGNIPDENTKGYYVGRFIEALLVHFRDDFSTFTVSK